MGPSQSKAETFSVADQREVVFNFAAPRLEKGPFAGRVVTGQPLKPVAGAIVDGKYRIQTFVGPDLRLKADDEGRFRAERALHKTVLRATSEDGALAGIVEIGPDEAEVTIEIGPLASAAGRLIDSETGNVLANTKVWWGRRVHRGDDNAPWETAWGGTEVTDALGRFQMRGMVVGQKYDLSVPRGDGTYGGLPSITPKSADPVDMGDVALKPPYKPPTFEEKVDRELASKLSAGDRYERALKEAVQLRQHVLVVFFDRAAPLTVGWMKLRLDDRPVRSALHNYQLVQIDIKSESARALAERLDVTLDEKTLPVWRLSDASGVELEKSPVPRSSDGQAIDEASLRERLARHAPEPLDARELLKNALADAAQSKRRVIVQETATWCGPCHRLADYLEHQRSIWEKDYIWVRVDQRWHGSDEVMKGIKDGRRGGIPWYAILDESGKVLATSDGPDGNIGFPSEPASVDHFVAIIKSTSQRISEQDLATLRAGLSAP
jgi:hypothetical protein